MKAKLPVFAVRLPPSNRMPDQYWAVTNPLMPGVPPNLTPPGRINSWAVLKSENERLAVRPLPNAL